MTSLSKRLWRWSAGLFAALVIFAGILVGLFRVAVLHVPEYRLPLEEWASATLGLPVEIGRMDARFRLDGPELVLYDTAVLSADGSQQLMRAAEGSVSLDVSRLLFNWVVQGDRFTLDGAELEMRRDAAGGLHVLGLEIGQIQPGAVSVKAEFRLKDSSLVIQDEMAGGEVWRFEDVETSVSASAARLRIDGSLQPPAPFGDRISFWFDSAAPSGGKPRSSSAFVSLGRLDLAVLRRLPRTEFLPGLVGLADLRLWLDMEGSAPRRVAAELKADGVAFAAAAVGAAGAGFERIQTRLDWDHGAAGWRLSIQDLLVSRLGRSWGSPLVRVETSAAPDQAGATWLVEADHLRLQDLAVALPLIPAGQLRDDLAALQPAGDLRNLLLHVERFTGETPRYQVAVQTRMDDLSIRPLRKMPGVDGISGELRNDEQGGRIELDADRAVLAFPGLFREPIAFDRLSGLLVWSRSADDLTIIADALSFSNADLDGDASGRLRLPLGDDPGSIDIQARLNDIDLSQASRYLPVGIMKPTLVGWLDRAIVDGRAPRTTVELHGPLRGFPYRAKEGRFEVSFGVENLRLDYAQGWPAGEQIAGDILFENEGFSADLSAGRLRGMSVEDVRVAIPDLRRGQLSIVGSARGPLAALHEYVVISPVGAALGDAFASVKVTAGEASADVDLLLPLQDMPSRRVVVDVDIADGEARYAEIRHPVEQLTGRLRVENSTVTGENVTARLAGEPVRIDVAPVADKSATRAYLSGSVSDHALVDVLELPLRGHLTGRAEWRGYLHFPSAAAVEAGDSFHVVTESDLVGIASTLPAPLAKTAEASLPLSIEYDFPEPGFTEWYAVLGDRLGAAVRFETGAGALRFVKAGIQVGNTEAGLPDEDGLSVKGHVPKLSADDWIGVRFDGDGEARLEEVLRDIDLHVSDLVVAGQHYPGVSVRMSPAEGVWQITADSETVSGSVQVPFDLAGGAPVVADLERLALDDAPEDGAGGEATDPNDVPAIQGTIDSFSIEGLNLGRVELSIDKIAGGIEIRRFVASGAAYTIEADGRSILSPLEDETNIRVIAESTGVGDTLEFMGFNRSVDAETGRLEVDLHWTGGLPASVFAVAEGTASMEIRNGSLIEVKPGAGRVFGLLSVQALPRRLTLDFRDVFKKGFFFDKLQGDFTVAGGEAFTENLVFRSPAADIGMVGSIDLLGRSYDQTAVVSAEVGNTLPIVGTIAAGPIIGAGLFVLKEILKEPLSDIAAVQYQITGPWENPTVERVAASTAGPQPEGGTQISRSDAGEKPDEG